MIFKNLLYKEDILDDVYIYCPEEDITYSYDKCSCFADKKTRRYILVKNSDYDKFMQITNYDDSFVKVVFDDVKFFKHLLILLAISLSLILIIPLLCGLGNVIYASISLLFTGRV